MTERLSIPRGLLFYARKMRFKFKLDKAERQHEYIDSLRKVYPDAAQRYIDLHIPQG